MTDTIMTRLIDGTTRPTKLQDVIDAHGVTLTLKEDAERYDPEWRDATHYRATLKLEGRRMTVPYRCGSACNVPTTYDVLRCLLDDAESIHNTASFEEWCDDLGYDSDSRKAERVYKACERQTFALHRLLGEHYAVFAEVEWE